MNEVYLRPPGHGNNCHGHNTSIAHGGHGHWKGDSCGCGGTISSSINMGIPILFMIALIIILFKKNYVKYI